MKSRIKSLRTFVIIIFLAIFMHSLTSHTEINTILSDATPEQNIHAPKTALELPRKNNPIHIIVVFSKFKGEAPGDSFAPVWAEKIFDNTQGSVPHYFDTIPCEVEVVNG